MNDDPRREFEIMLMLLGVILLVFVGMVVINIM